MQIKFVRKIKAKDLIKEFEKKYGSLERLERYLERHPDDYVALMDYEDWKHFLENPDVEVEEGEIFVTNVSFLTPQKLQLLEAIKKHRPKSIRELAEKVGRDVKNVYMDVKELEKIGLIELKDSGRAKKVELKYNEIHIII
ncbi:transcriptional regulator protein-like protein [Ferroglobus placidus DSM 10642]|uniref:Transcriptional regulator protein-like protein n=1 Tax=Ferroglobus placidus (strain DSM 10642 / AEDII12DO) TaxID=589924 RepID=D3RYA5_FERPA|nr:winged helix-turn-helix transcriptional regulator [Ferroglobus placidus]ADC65468.1 transcriptional regulator protein-like protein [Ferroglobus placidus DSM 10642]